MTMSIIPGICRYYIQRKWLMNIRGHRQFLMTPTAFHQYPQMLPKVPLKIPPKVRELCPLLLLPSSYPAFQLLHPSGPFQLPTQSAVLQFPSHPAPPLLFGSSILPSPPAPLFSATVRLPYGTPPPQSHLPAPSLQLPSSSATSHPAYIPYSIPSSHPFPFSSHPAHLPSCSLPVTLSSSLYTEPELRPFVSSCV